MAKVVKDGADVRAYVGDFAITPKAEFQNALKAYDGQNVWLGIRAENMDVVQQPTENTIPVKVEVLEPLGSQNLLTITIEGAKLKVSTHPNFIVAPGDTIWLHFPTDKIRWIDQATERAIVPDLREV